MKIQQNKKFESITLTIDGELLERGSVDYKTFLDILDGTIGALEGSFRVANYKQLIDFNVRPPEVGSFKITIDIIDLMTAMVPLFHQASPIQDVIKIFLEYLKIKRASKGEDIDPKNIQKNENGQTIVKDNQGNVFYQDNKKITNVNIIQNFNGDPAMNKKIDKIAKAMEANQKVETISYSENDNKVQIARNEAEYLRYQEKLEQKPNSVVGYIRKIDNKSFRGTLIMQEDGRNKNIEFELEIKDIKLLDKIVSNLAHAEADKVRVVLIGDQLHDSKGKLRKIIVNDVDIPDSKFDF